MCTKNIILNKKIFYNLAELDTAHTIKLIKIIKILDFKLLIIENLPCNTDSEDDKIIKPIKNTQNNQPNIGFFEGVKK